ncbi:MAG: isoaspartyl peptidase/L-asparaginase family protein [Candidatus Asgardarchaeia archaeon]
MFGVIVHGGAGKIKNNRDAVLNGVKKAVACGYDILKSGGTAIHAVEESVKYFEDDESFNAGFGAVLTYDGNVELDAAIMDGKTLSCGATALVNSVAHPIELARKIMEMTDHVFIAGDYAERLARIFGLEFRNQVSQRRLEYWQGLKRKIEQEKKEIEYLPKISKLIRDNIDALFGDTVGAVALDKYGNLAAATSTGGLMLKLPGRIGDTPLIGCGTYADNNGGAVSVTGIGEVAIKLNLAFFVSLRISQGCTPQNAVKEALEKIKIYQNNAPMGIIAINKKGEIGIGHTSPDLSWAYWLKDMKEPKYGLKYSLK